MLAGCSEKLQLTVFSLFHSTREYFILVQTDTNKEVGRKLKLIHAVWLIFNLTPYSFLDLCIFLEFLGIWTVANFDLTVDLSLIEKDSSYLKNECKLQSSW